MLYLLYDPSDPKNQFVFMEPVVPDLRHYRWFNLSDLDNCYNRYEGSFDNITLDFLKSDTGWQVIATFEAFPTAAELRSFLESSPELFL